MKFREVTVLSIIKAIKNHLVSIVVISGLFLFIGITLGYFDGKRGQIEKTNAKAYEIEIINEKEVKKDRNYYQNYLEKIKSKYNLLAMYVNSVNNRIENEELKSEIKELKLKLEEFYEQKILELEDYNFENYPILPEYLETKKVELKRKIHTYSLDEIRIQEILDELVSVGKDEEHIQQYASQLGDIKKTVKEYEDILSILESKTEEEVEINSVEMEELLIETGGKENNLVKETNTLMKKIAEKEYIIISIKDESEILFFDTYKPDSMVERWCAYSVFFLLFGVCIGMFRAIVKECKISK